MTDALRDFVRSLPKAELHVHLEGSLAPDLALRLAARQGVDLPGAADGVEGLRRHYAVGGFRSFIDLYLALSRCFGTVDAISDATDALAHSHAAQGVVHAQITFTPMTHHARGVGLDVLQTGLAQGRARARARGVRVRWVFDVVRHLPDTGDPTLAFAVAMAERDPGSVVGLGLSGPEREGSVAPYVKLFERARARGFLALPHAGEQAGPQNVRDAVELLAATRIGHGVRAIEDPAVMDLLRERDVVLEVCPSSNVALGIYPGLEAHPLPRLLEAGVGVALASDDPPVFGTSLLEEYIRCARCFGWSRDRLRALAAVSMAAADQAYQG